MRPITKLLAALCAALMPLCAIAQDSPLRSLETAQDARGWEGVGRLDIAGKGFCTAALIEARLILTAAHCLYDANGNLLDPARFVFRAGLRGGRAELERGVRRYVAHPAYIFPGTVAQADTVGNDIALLELDQPIRSTTVHPFDIAPAPVQGETVGIVSYAQDREEAPSLQEVCGVLGQRNAMIVMTCDITFGASGAPVFRIENGVARIVSVISAMAQMDGTRVSLGTSLGQPLTELRAAFAALGPAMPGGAGRVLVAGARNETGARFVRVDQN